MTKKELEILYSEKKKEYEDYQKKTMKPVKGFLGMHKSNSLFDLGEFSKILDDLRTLQAQLEDYDYC
jgi:hypothetical protein